MTAISFLFKNVADEIHFVFGEFNVQGFQIIL